MNQNPELGGGATQIKAGAAINSEVSAAGTAALRPRRVFGRRDATVDGKTMRIEMRADGLHVRRYRGRKEKVVTFTDLVHVANGQALLKL